jgi:hypothetical protein
LVESFDADMGGTEIYACLQDGLDDTPPNPFEKIFVFLTDGQVSNINSISNLIKGAKNTRIFSIGIGSDADRNLIQTMAAQTAGECKFITDIKDLDKSIQSILTIVNKQYYSNVRLGLDLIVYPSIYPGRTYRWVGKNLSPDNLVIKATNPIDLTIKTWDLSSIDQIEYPNQMISQLYANVLIDYLDSVVPKTPEQIDQIIKLSTDYQIMSPHTSYILVDSEVTSDPSLLIQTSVPHYSAVRQQRGGFVAKRSGKHGFGNSDSVVLGSRIKLGAGSASFGSASSNSLGSSIASYFMGAVSSLGSLGSKSKLDEVDALDGGMDMFGSKSKSKSKPKPQINTTMNLAALVRIQETDGSFEITFKDLLYQSSTDYLKASNQVNLGPKVYNNIIMYGYLANSFYTKEFAKLQNWFIRYHPDIEIGEINKIFTTHIQYIKKLEDGLINSSSSSSADY